MTARVLRRRFLATIFASMALAAGLFSTAGQPAGASTSTGTGTKAAPPHVFSSAQLRRLRTMYATYRHIPAADVTVPRPGLARKATAANGTTWALVGFSSSRKAPTAVQAGFQDGAYNGIFTRAPGNAWRMRGVGRPDLACDGSVPLRVRRAWGLARCQPLRAGHPRAGQPRASRPRTRDATLADLSSSIVSLANQYAQIPIKDNPGAPANSFTFDCNPFSSLLNEPGTADSACKTDPTFNIQDSNQQWCSDFVIYVWKQAGALGPLDDLTPLSSSFYTYGQDEGESMPVDPPASAAQPGDAMILYPAGSTPGAFGGLHVGIVTAVNANGTLDIVNGDFLSGNQIEVVDNTNVTPQDFANNSEVSPTEPAPIEWTFVAPATDMRSVPDLSVDGLTSTWQTQSDFGSTGNPPPTTAADCGEWSGGDATQVVRLDNGDNLWSFGDTELGPAVTRQDFFNNSSIRNSMVLQNPDDSSPAGFTTITGADNCPVTTGIHTPVTPPSSSPGDHDWPSSSIVSGSNLVKFYYSASGLTQESPQVVDLPQSTFESGNPITVTSTPLDGCVKNNPIMWGAATIRATTDGTAYTYIYGNQSPSGGEGPVYLARTSGDPGDQSTWTYYTGNGTFTAGSCDGLSLAQLGGLQVATEFSVTSVGGQFWLTQLDPASGTFPGWAAVHSAAQPWSFSGAPGAGLPLFSLGQSFGQPIDDTYPGFFAYAVRMLDPSAVTASTPGDVVIAFNVNDHTTVDTGCIPLIDYDANVYRPRFIDVPAADFTTGSPLALLAGAARARARVSTAGRTVSAADSSSYIYNPDGVPPNATWSTTPCPTTSNSSYFQPVTPNVTVTQNPDGSLDLSWPNQGPDVWYWVNWDDTNSTPPSCQPGVWTRNEFWSEGPNADGWQNKPAQGLTPSDDSTIRLHFVPSGGKSGDSYSFYVQAFAAGNGKLTSNDSCSTFTPPKASIIAKPTNLTATEVNGTVQLSWNTVAQLPGETVVYFVRYEPHGAGASNWTQPNGFVNGTSYTFPTGSLTAGQPYDFEIAAADTSGSGPWTDPVPFTP